MASRVFFCESCGARGKIALKGDEHSIEDIVCCPVCGADISEEDDLDLDD